MRQAETGIAPVHNHEKINPFGTPPKEKQ